MLGESERLQRQRGLGGEATSGASRERRRRPAGGRAGRWKWKQHHKAERDERRGLFFSQVGHVGVCVGRAREQQPHACGAQEREGGAGVCKSVGWFQKKMTDRKKGIFQCSNWE